MALIIKDRVKEITTTTGTGAVSLGGASATFDAFQSVMSNGDTTFYAIVHTASGTDEWEVGLGTWNTGNTLTRTTVYAGSNGTSAVNFSSGNKDIFMTYPASKAAVAGEDVTFADVTATDITATGTVTLSGDPTSALQAATKEYVDTIAAAGIHYHTPVRVEAPSALTATYDNGTSGVGATLTNSGTQAALVIDGVTLSTSDRVLVYNQSNAAHNGIYTVTNTGSASTNWVLTRATDADSYGASDQDALGEGDAFFVKEGDTGAGELYVMNTSGTITFGTTNISFTVVAETAVYSAGNSLTLDGTTFDTVQDIRTTASPTFNNITVTGTVDGRDVATDGSKLDGIEANATADQTAAEIKTAYESNSDTNAFTDAEQTKLSGIETGATGDQTASEILTAIKTVDGAGSNLDADLLDGQQGSYYLNTSTTFSGDVSGTYNNIVVANDSHTHDGRYYTETEADSRFVNVTGDSMTGTLTLHSGQTYETKLGRHPTHTSYGGLWNQDSIESNSSTYMILNGGSGDDATYINGDVVYIRAGNNSSTNQLTVTTSGTTIGGNTVWHAGNDGSGSGLDADTVDGVQASSFLRSDASDSFSGTLTYTGSGIAVNTGGDNIDMGTMTIVGSNGTDGWASKPGIKLDSTGDFRIHASSGDATLYVDGEIYAGAGAVTQRVFHNSYHPNADKWTTARTLSLSGDASGSVSWDGSANATLSVTVANNSHTHTVSNISDRPTNFSATAQTYTTISSGEWDLRTGSSVFAKQDSSGGPGTDGYWFVTGRRDTQGGYSGIFTPHGDGKAYVGYNSSGSNNPVWATIWTSTTDGSGSGLDADLLDGSHASAFALKSGTTFTGQLDVDQELRIINGDTSETHFNYNDGSNNYIRGGTTYIDTTVDLNQNNITDVGTLTAVTIRPGDGNDGYFASDQNGRTIFDGGDFYIRSGVSNFYNYATNQYLGGSSGDNIYVRGNTISGNSWNITGAGVATFGTDVRAPVFYDSNNTSYYVDPAASSTSLNLNGNGKFKTNSSDQRVLYLQQHATNGGNIVQFTDQNGSNMWELVGRNNWFYIYNNQNNKYGALSINPSTNNMWINPGSSYTTDAGYNLRVTGNFLASTDIRAPIFYDSNDTALYVNPNSTSSMWNVNIRGDLNSTATSNQIFFWGNGSTTTSAIGFKSNGGNFSNPTGNGDGYNTYLTMDTAGRGWVFRRGTGGTDFSAAYTAGWILNNGIWQAQASMRAPIFYDSGNTGYYLDPASTSRMDSVQFYDRIGIGTNGTRGYVNSGSAGIWYSTTTDAIDWFGGLDGSNWRLYYSNANKMYIDTSANLYAYGSMRAPIFYDNDNTAFYINPAQAGVSAKLSGYLEANGYNNTCFLGGGAITGAAGVSLIYNAPHVAFNSYYNNGWVRQANNQHAALIAYNTSTNAYVFNFSSNTTGTPTWVNSHTFDRYGNIFCNGSTASVRGKVWYDIDNTTFYADLSSTADSIRAAGNIVAYYSDERLKDIEGNIDSPLEKVSKLNGFYYTANEKAQQFGYDAKRQVGVSAQEVEAVLPEIVTDAAIGHGYKTVDYSKMVPLLIEAIKEQQQQIDELKTKLGM